MLANSKTGYNYSFDMYIGRDDDLDDFMNIGKVSGIVLKLAVSMVVATTCILTDFTSAHTYCDL